MEGFFIRDAERAARAMVEDISRSDSPLPAISDISLVIPAEVFQQSGKHARRVRLSSPDSSSQQPPPDTPASPEASGEDSQLIL